MAWSLGGCAPQAPSVWVDLSLASSPAGAPLSVNVPGSAPIPGGSAQLPPVPSQTILSGDVESMTKEAVEKGKASQRRLYDELSSRLEEVYLAEVEREAELERTALWEEYQQNLTEAFEEIRRRFELTSGELGQLRSRLAWLAGFPDPDPNNRREPRGTYIEREDARRASEIRPRVAELKGQLDAQVEAILSEVAGSYRVDLEAVEEAAEEKSAAAVARARKEALEESGRGALELEKSSFDPERTLPSAPGATVSRPEHPRIPSQTWRSARREVWPQAEKLRAEALVFARARGWRLSENARGVPDKTKEFLQWRKDMGLSPSQN